MRLQCDSVLYLLHILDEIPVWYPVHILDEIPVWCPVLSCYIYWMISQCDIQCLLASLHILDEIPVWCPVLICYIYWMISQCDVQCLFATYWMRSQCDIQCLFATYWMRSQCDIQCLLATYWTRSQCDIQWYLLHIWIWCITEPGSQDPCRDILGTPVQGESVERTQVCSLMMFHCGDPVFRPVLRLVLMFFDGLQ
jgi:hypothetical protein